MFMTRRAKATINRMRPRRGVTLTEFLIAGGLFVIIAAGLVSLSIMVGRMQKGIYSQQIALKNAKKTIETINREIRLAKVPLRVVDANGNPVQAGNRVEFSRWGETTVRSIELISHDDDLATPWDNTLIYDPDTSVSGDEVEVTKGISAIQQGAAFRYTGATTPLIVKMRTGDSVRVENTQASDAYTGPGMQGFEINITVAPRNE